MSDAIFSYVTGCLVGMIIGYFIVSVWLEIPVIFIGIIILFIITEKIRGCLKWRGK